MLEQLIILVSNSLSLSLSVIVNTILIALLSPGTIHDMGVVIMYHNNTRFDVYHYCACKHLHSAVCTAACAVERK